MCMHLAVHGICPINFDWLDQMPQCGEIFGRVGKFGRNEWCNIFIDQLKIRSSLGSR